MIDYDTRWLLEQWARWSNVNPGLSLAYPNATPFRRLLGTTVPSALISDEEAEMVDRAVAKLLCRHPQMGKVVALYYLSGCNVSWVAKAMGIYRQKANELLQSGTAWLDGVLAGSEAA